MYHKPGSHLQLTDYNVLGVEPLVLTKFQAHGAMGPPGGTVCLVNFLVSDVVEQLIV